MPEQNESSKNVSEQRHYTQFEIQPIEFIERNKLGWCAGNAVKYICRHKLKNGEEDIRKAIDYLKCLLYMYECSEFKNPQELKEEGYKV